MSPTRPWWTQVTSGALALGVVHAFVDCASGFIIFRDLGPSPLDRTQVIAMVVLYNVLAFGGQSLAGLAADRLGNYRAMAVAGAALAAVALVLGPHSLVPAIVVVGLGNALFHVGAGADILRSSGDRAADSGVFVGPGSLGLAAGIWLGGHHDLECRYWIVALLAISLPVLPLVARAAMPRVTQDSLPRARDAVLVALVCCALFLLVSVTVRSIVGGTVAGTWRGVSTEVMIGLAIAACAGKMMGGFIADRVGWATVSVVALLASAPLVSVLVTHPAGAIVGMLLFQMTMAVTLKATHHLMPGRPGLAFGIPCLALVAGAIPGLIGYGGWFSPWPLVLGMVLLAAGLIAAGLHLLSRAGGALGPSPELAGWLQRR